MIIIFFNPDACKYFVKSIAKAYEGLTDPICRENFENYEHPGQQELYLTNYFNKVYLND